jgi:3-isopropylmalate dehydratase small subunit
MRISGRIHVFGDHIDTDVILPTHAIVTTDPTVLRKHCLSGLVENFAARVQPGDFIVAGENFGCGSSREHAPLALKAAGIGCIVAASFSRIFYRNAINIGLGIIECAQARDHAAPGAPVTADFETSTLTLGEWRYDFPRLPPEVLQILMAGGLVPYMQRRLQRGAYVQERT